MQLGCRSWRESGAEVNATGVPKWAQFCNYTEILQFEKFWDWGDPPDFGCVAFGDVQLFLCQGGQGQPGTWLYLMIDGVDDYFNEIKQRGADILLEPTDMPWGLREMQVRDLEGHVLRIGTSLERLIPA